MDLAEISERLKIAIQERDSQEALNLVARYREEFDRVWAALPDEERRRSKLPEEAMELHREVFLDAVAARGEIAAELSDLRKARKYDEHSGPAGTWRAMF